MAKDLGMKMKPQQFVLTLAVLGSPPVTTQVVVITQDLDKAKDDALNIDPENLVWTDDKGSKVNWDDVSVDSIVVAETSNTPRQEPIAPENWFAWKELVNTEDGPRLLIPWSDPHVYETPIDNIFTSIEQAKEWKKEFAPWEKLILVRETITPVDIVYEEPEDE